jgi:glycosyltransferase involved in cell wall biosynthesis
MLREGDENGPTENAFVADLIAARVSHMLVKVSGGWRQLVVGKEVYRLLKRLAPAVLVTFMFHANVVGRVLGRIARIPVVISSIRSEFFGGAGRDRLERVTSNLAVRTVVNSAIVADKLVARGVLRRSRVAVVPNALQARSSEDESGSPAELRAELEVPDKSFLWLAAGRLDVPKDYPGLVRAFRIVVDAHPTAQLRIAGEGISRREVTDLLVRLGLAENVRLLGFRKDVPALFRAADGFVLSSAWEGLPNALMEAMAEGKPIVTTRVGGVLELVEDGVTGIIVPPRDPIALADGMLRVTRMTAGERTTMGDRGRSQMQDSFGLEGIASRWETLFRDTLRSAGVTAI